MSYKNAFTVRQRRADKIKADETETHDQSHDQSMCLILCVVNLCSVLFSQSFATQGQTIKHTMEDNSTRLDWSPPVCRTKLAFTHQFLSHGNKNHSFIHSTILLQINPLYPNPILTVSIITIPKKYLARDNWSVYSSTFSRLNILHLFILQSERICYYWYQRAYEQFSVWFLFRRILVTASEKRK